LSYQIINEALIDAHFSAVGGFFGDLDALTLLRETLLNLLLLKFLVSEWVVASEKFLVRFELHKVSMHGALEHRCADQVRRLQLLQISCGHEFEIVVQVGRV